MREISQVRFALLSIDGYLCALLLYESNTRKPFFPVWFGIGE